MKKLLVSLLAVSFCLAAFAGCGGTNDNSNPDSSSAPVEETTTDIEGAADYLDSWLIEQDVETRRDFTRPNSLVYPAIGGHTYTITWSVDVAEDIVKLVVDGDNTKVDVNEDMAEDTEFVLTATVSDGNGNEKTVDFYHTLLKAPAVVPQAITEAPVEGAEYRLYMYQVTKKGESYFTGTMSKFYLATSSEYTEAVIVTVENVEGKEGYYYMTFVDPSNNNKQYLGVTNTYNNGSWHDNAIYAPTTEITEDDNINFEWSFNAEYKVMVSTLSNVKTGNDQATTEGTDVTYYLGTDSGYWTFGAMNLNEITNDDACIGYLVEMIDKSTISAEDKIAAEKTALSITTAFNGEATAELPVKGSTYGDVTITWAVKEGELVSIADNILTVTAPTAPTKATITATLACGEVSETVEFELSLNLDLPDAVTAPEANVTYKMYLYQAGLEKILYVTGTYGARYLDMTENGAEAVDVFAEAATDGYKFYIVVDGVNQYLTIYTNSSDKTAVKFDAGEGSVFYYKDNIKAWCARMGDNEFYIGTYSTFNTISASFSSYVTAENTGVDQFPAVLCKASDVKVDETPDVGGDEEPEVQAPAADSVITIKEALAYGATFAHDTYSTDKYYVEATVKKVYNTQYGNMYLVDAEGNELTVYGTYNADGTVRYDAMESKPVDGDTVKIYGVIGTYNGIVQFKNAWIIEFAANEDYVEPALPENFVQGLPEAGKSYYLRAIDHDNSYIQGVSDNGKYLTVGATPAMTVTFELVEGTTNEYYIKLSNGQYINSASSGNSVSFGAEAVDAWIIDTEANTIQLKSDTQYYLQYNPSSPRITRYKGTQQAIWFELAA
ncbi:MAG: hypothetical protein IJX30_01930 [Clostridia bacterium]|nr:hypothetical protein [Clostridia bacterium]